MKKEYMKPELRMVQLRHRTRMLEYSTPKSVKSKGFDEDDEFKISESPAGTNFWAR